jgi:hypothetical protein
MSRVEFYFFSTVDGTGYSVQHKAKTFSVPGLVVCEGNITKVGPFCRRSVAGNNSWCLKKKHPGCNHTADFMNAISVRMTLSAISFCQDIMHLKSLNIKNFCRNFFGPFQTQTLIYRPRVISHKARYRDCQ